MKDRDLTLPLKVLSDCIGFALLRPVIGAENSRQLVTARLSLRWHTANNIQALAFEQEMKYYLVQITRYKKYRSIVIVM